MFFLFLVEVFSPRFFCSALCHAPFSCYSPNMGGHSWGPMGHPFCALVLCLRGMPSNVPPDTPTSRKGCSPTPASVLLWPILLLPTHVLAIK